MLYISAHRKTMSFSTKNNFLTVQEVAAYLKLSVITIYKYIRENKLQAIEFGGHYRIEQSSLDQFINDHKVIKNIFSNPKYEKED